VAKDHRLGNTGSLGNLPGGGALETFVGKETYSHSSDLKAALFAGHSGGAGRERGVSGGRDSFTHLLLIYLSLLRLETLAGWAK